MREQIGTAHSYKEINLWRAAAKKYGLPLWIEVHESFDPPEIYANITVYDPDWNGLWYKRVDEIRKIGRWPSVDDINRLRYDTIKGIKSTYQELFDTTPEGKRAIKKKAAEQKKKDKAAMREYMSRPNVRKKMSEQLHNQFAENSWLILFGKMRR